MPLPDTQSPVRSERNVWLTVPNALTLARLIAIGPFIFFAIHGRDREALILYVLAGLTVFTTIQRIAHVRSELNAAARA